MVVPVDRRSEDPSEGGPEWLVPSFLTCPAQVFGRPVCRLGLATRNGSVLTPDDVLYALDCGINYWNWPGVADVPGGPDAVSQAVAALGPRRESVVVSVQFGARTATEAAIELRQVLTTLKTDTIDVLTFYYVEDNAEWLALSAPGGALDYCRSAQHAGVIRKIGITSHQRPLAAEMARSGRLDLLMIRYNAAHRGAERDVFPTTDRLGLPVITYTALRWGALLRPTLDDPPAFAVPPAPSWYRFALHSPSVAVTLMAPHNRAELEQNVAVLNSSGPLDPIEYRRLVAHGDRVRRHAGRFP